MRVHRFLTTAMLALLAACTDRLAPTETPAPPAFIVNGVPTGDAYPNVGALLFDFDRNGVLDGNDELCTGSLIAPTVFLTAAHCVAGAPANTPFFVSFAPDLYARSIKTIRAAGFAYDPAFGHDRGDLHDLAVVFLPSNATRGLTPLQLPRAGLLDQLAANGGLVDQIFVNVGYGTSSTRTGPPAFPYDGRRNQSESEFMGLQPSWLGLLMNSNATDLGGDCYGDSGGPKFFRGNTSLIVATVTTGDFPCRATTWDYRLDTPSARAFLGQFVSLP